MLCGIDPGFGGALAFYDPKRAELIAVVPMPLLETRSVMLGGASKKEIDASTFASLIRAMPPTLIIMEHVAASPQMGVVSAFRFGEGFGQIRGILAAYGHTVRLVKPSVWKASLGLSHDKSLSVAKAIEIFPSWSDEFRRGKSSADKAEAALLAYYGERMLAKKEGPWEE